MRLGFLERFTVAKLINKFASLRNFKVHGHSVYIAPLTEHGNLIKRIQFLS